MSIHRQGNNEQRVISATGPDQRSDGTPLEKSDVSHFEFDMEYEGGLAVDSLPVTLSDNAETPEWDGTFSESIDIDSQTPGIYTIRYRTVDTEGNKSINSGDLSIEILSPLALPNPPANLF